MVKLSEDPTSRLGGEVAEREGKSYETASEELPPCRPIETANRSVLRTALATSAAVALVDTQSVASEAVCPIRERAVRSAVP
eukprot:1198670-Rhodomonas_salina.2